LQRDDRARKLTTKTLKKQQAEWALGSSLAAHAEEDAVMFTDEFIVHYVNRIEQRIVDSSQLPGCFVVKIMVDPEPNAYSLPGGFVYLTTGLIEVAESEGQLAAALAHETAHVTARHMTRFVAETRIWGRLALFSGPAGYLLRRYMGPFFMLSFVRQDELEADQLGLRYHNAAGYDTLEFCRMLQNATPEDDQNETFLERLRDAHPRTSVRVKRLQSISRNLQWAQTGNLVSTNEFQDMKARFATLNVSQ
jgi:predicted Zn-dependent protease